MTCYTGGVTSTDTTCPAYKAIQLLQEKWVLHIVRTLLAGPRGFNELSRMVGGCNPATLANRLDRLEELGLLTRTVTSIMPPRTVYTLTPAGVALNNVIQEIEQWGARYLEDRVPEESVR